jgi:hypothetical protein
MRFVQLFSSLQQSYDILSIDFFMLFKKLFILN